MKLEFPLWQGEFESGVFSGKGTYTTSKGYVLSGVWKENRLVKEVRFTDLDETTWVGSLDLQEEQVHSGVLQPLLAT